MKSLETKEEEYYKHPAFGQILFSRIVGNANFYGSELQQDHYIQMELRESEIRRDLSKDWYYAHGLPLAKIRMSAGQFSEMITSMNSGGGVCCTIEMIDRKPVEKMPLQESRKEFTHRKFEDRMKEFAITLKEKQSEAKKIISKKTLSIIDQKELNFFIEWLTQEVANNIPFFAKCFQETMDDIVLEAKTEVENAIQQKINTLGLNALHEQNKLLK